MLGSKHVVHLGLRVLWVIQTIHDGGTREFSGLQLAIFMGHV